MNRFKSVFFHWLPLGIVVICAFAAMYAVGQHIYRTNLNDPQIEMVTKAANSLNQDIPLEELVTNDEPMDITTDPRAFITIFDEVGDPLASTGNYGDALPRPPHGVFVYAKENGENRVTWQPAWDTRIALVIRPLISGGFVAAGRNMAEVETRIHDLFTLCLWGMILTLVLTFVADMYGDAWRVKEMHKTNEKKP